MIFPYLDVRRGGVIHTQPIIPVGLHGPAGVRHLFALVDSGAEHSVFSLDLVASLQLHTDNANVVEIIGIGGNASRGYLLDVQLQLQKDRWVGPAVFCDVLQSGSPMICRSFAGQRLTWWRRRWSWSARAAARGHTTRMRTKSYG